MSNPSGWIERLLPFYSHSNDAVSIWFYFPSGELLQMKALASYIPMFVHDTLWTNFKQTPECSNEHPLDYEYNILTRYARSVYMVWSSVNTDLQHNTIGARILSDLLKYEVPGFSDKSIGKDPFKYIPRGPIVFIQTLKGKPFEYTFKQLRMDWNYFFRTNTPSERLIKVCKYTNWYTPLQTILKCRSDPIVLAKLIAEFLLERPVNKCTQNDRMESALLGAALIILTGAKWYDKSFPSIHIKFKDFLDENGLALPLSFWNSNIDQIQTNPVNSTHAVDSQPCDKAK